jgi:hypothetical protein
MTTTFTFDNTLSDDLALVRFHIGDTDSAGYYLADETITALLTIEGSVGAAVIACIKYIITQLSAPNFRYDFLSVSNEQARQGFENLLKTKAMEFGVSPSGVTASSTISLPYRADSYQHSTGERVDDTDEDETSVYDGTP